MNHDDSVRRYLPSLRNALLLLSLPAAVQLQRCSPGCVACDLIDDFEISSTDVLGHLKLEDEQIDGLRELQKAVAQMKKADLECFNPEVLQRSAWQALRERSHHVLTTFGWQDARLEQFNEVEPGVWLRRRAEM